MSFAKPGSLARKIQNRIFHRWLGKLTLQTEQDFYTHPSAWKRFKRDVNQSLNEKGVQTPFIFTKQECLAFWRSLSDQHGSTGNHPSYYSQKPIDIVDILHRFWAPEVQPQMSILELGCNCGANLHWLDHLGYSALSGIEINPTAIGHMQTSYPGLKDRVRVTQGSLDQALGGMASGSVDVIFTMGVSMHIHPKDNGLFQEMMRVAARYVCMIEPEPANSNYVFARDYRRVFERLGAKHIKSQLLFGPSYQHVPDYLGSTLRLFAVSR